MHQQVDMKEGKEGWHRNSLAGFAVMRGRDEVCSNREGRGPKQGSQRHSAGVTGVAGVLGRLFLPIRERQLTAVGTSNLVPGSCHFHRLYPVGTVCNFKTQRCPTSIVIPFSSTTKFQHNSLHTRPSKLPCPGSVSAQQLIRPLHLWFLTCSC